MRRAIAALISAMFVLGAHLNATAAGDPGRGAKKSEGGRAAQGRAASGPARRGRAAGKAADAGKPQAPAIQPPAQSPAAVIKPAADYVYGESSSVTVDPRKPTVIKLGLAQNATSIVEFPAADSIYYHHEGNQELVQVFDSKTKATDHFIVVYPGRGFVAPSQEMVKQGARVPAATVTLQMTSGLVLTLEFVPVSDISKNAHRCVINYNRDDVVAARRAAGLAVNLEGKEPDARKTGPNSSLVAGGGGEPRGEEQAGPKITPVVADVDSSKADASRGGKKGKKQAEPSEAANKALVAAVKGPEKLFTKWSPVSGGMSVSLAPAADIDDRARVVVVAVKNTTAAGIRLVPGTPEIFLQVFDDGGTPLRTEQVNRLQVETTALGGRIPAGQVVYYAIVYETLILGSRERLRVSVSQMESADVGASADVTQGNR